LEAEALLEAALVVADLVVVLEAEALEVEVPLEAGRLIEKQFLILCKVKSYKTA
jgi:hypothetical protein